MGEGVRGVSEVDWIRVGYGVIVLGLSQSTVDRFFSFHSPAHPVRVVPQRG